MMEPGVGHQPLFAINCSEMQLPIQLRQPSPARLGGEPSVGVDLYLQLWLSFLCGFVHHVFKNINQRNVPKNLRSGSMSALGAGKLYF